MVEISLAMAVLALGVISIMALFPIGLNANRDAMAENYAADSADMLLHYYSSMLKTSWTDAQAQLPPAKATTEGAWTGTPVSLSPSTVLTPDSVANSGVCKVEQRTGAAPGTVVDFAGVYRVWRSDVTYSYYNAVLGAWTPTATISQDTGLALNLEVSWPAQAAYTARQKVRYYLEVFRP